jgi:hypothetical protein
VLARKKKQAKGISIAAAASQVQKDQRPRRCDRSYPIAAAVEVRRLTQEDERRLEALLDLFLMQMVHEHFERQQVSC